MGRHLRGLFDACGLSLRQSVRRYGFSPAAISRYLSGERLPRKAFLDVLLTERARRTGADRGRTAPHRWPATAPGPAGPVWSAAEQARS
ncbi:helix-turn-helix domain-containing protein [Streptomyces radiopugnans]|uniref:helix-turn-helix domain-containing protein n=1 Tax=Streptomyces radiopugnans TaxID=403935 RepID=UPI003F1A75F2